jgi:hypothetical protein
MLNSLQLYLSNSLSISRASASNFQKPVGIVTIVWRSLEQRISQPTASSSPPPPPPPPREPSKFLKHAVGAHRGNAAEATCTRRDRPAGTSIATG